MDSASLGEVIASERKRLHLSQEQLAQIAGVSREWVSKVENNRGEHPSFDSLKDVAHALEIPPAALLQKAGYAVESPPRPPARSMVAILRQALAIAEKLEADTKNDPSVRRVAHALLAAHH